MYTKRKFDIQEVVAMTSMSVSFNIPNNRLNGNPRTSTRIILSNLLLYLSLKISRKYNPKVRPWIFKSPAIVNKKYQTALNKLFPRK